MKPAELHRLRTLLRENDPATGVDGPPAEQRARMRRTVLAAVREPGAGPPWLGTRQWALAAGAAALLVAGGTAVLRVLDAAPAPVELARSPIQAPPPPALPSAEPRAVDGAAAAPSSSAPEPRIATRAAARSERQPSTAAPRPPLVAASRAEREPTPATPTAAADHGNATAEGVAIAALPAPLGRQIQVTAPGGTRIVWILTPSTGP